uniref:Uncharacterized protein n=1 Tax=Panagrolaimus sp. PS1159 TaxID=55785 RepID=A0AC35GGN1_9BILA
MKSVLVIVIFCCCIELSYQRYLLRNDINGQQHDIVKRDLADDFFDKIVEKGKSFFVDDDEAKHDSDTTVNHDNNGDSAKFNNDEHKHDSDGSSVNHDFNDKFDNDRRDDNTNTHSNVDNIDHSSSNSKSHVSTKSDDNDDFISEETLKRILAKVVAYASSNDSDNQEQSDGSNTDSVKHDGSDSESDAMLDKLGNILIKEGIKIGVAELASSFLGKK